MGNNWYYKYYNNRYYNNWYYKYYYDRYHNNWYYKYYNNRYYNNWYYKYNYINYFNYYIDYINDYINYINNYSLNKDAIREESKVLILSQFFGMEHLKHYCTFWWRDLWDNGISVYDNVIVSIIMLYDNLDN